MAWYNFIKNYRAWKERREAEKLARRLGISDRVILTGEREDTLDLLRIFDVFVLSSRWEGLSYAMLEAMAMAKPVIATRIPGVDEVISDGETGCLVEPENADAIATGLLQVLRNPEDAKEMGERGRRLVGEHYRLQDQIESLSTCYEKLQPRSAASGATAGQRSGIVN